MLIILLIFCLPVLTASLVGALGWVVSLRLQDLSDALSVLVRVTHIYMYINLLGGGGGWGGEREPGSAHAACNSVQDAQAMPCRANSPSFLLLLIRLGLTARPSTTEAQRGRDNVRARRNIWAPQPPRTQDFPRTQQVLRRYQQQQRREQQQPSASAQAAMEAVRSFSAFRQRMDEQPLADAGDAGRLLDEAQERSAELEVAVDRYLEEHWRRRRARAQDDAVRRCSSVMILETGDCVHMLFFSGAP